MTSVLMQTYRAVELLVIDDGSAVEAAGIVERAARGDRRVQVVRFPEPRGAAAARNAAFERASGELVAFLDDDDRWMPDKLERQVAYLDDHPEVGILTTDFLVLDEARGDQPVRYRGPHQLRAEHLLWFNLPGTFMCAMVRRDAVGPELWLDETFPSVEDWDLFVRCARRTEVGVLPEALALQVLHGEGRLSDPASKLRGLQAFERRHAPAMSPACLAFLRAHQRMEQGTGWRKRANVARSLLTRSPAASALLLAEQSARQLARRHRDPGLVDRVLVQLLDRGLGTWRLPPTSRSGSARRALQPADPGPVRGGGADDPPTVRASAAAGPARAVRLLGVRLDDVTHEEAAARIVAGAAAGRGGWVVTPNVDVLRQLRRDRDFARLAEQADLSLADGMPLVWASRIQGTPLRGRVACSELIFPLTRAAAAAGVSMFLLGDTEDTARAAAARLSQHAPGLTIAGMYSPPLGFEHDPDELDRIVAALEASRPGIVVCALGTPKQERLIAELRPRFPATWFLGAGATLAMVSGRTPPAPAWMRRAGMEWVHRLRLEPRRLSGRYLWRDAPFALNLLVHSARVRWHSSACRRHGAGPVPPVAAGDAWCQ